MACTHRNLQHVAIGPEYNAKYAEAQMKIFLPERENDDNQKPNSIINAFLREYIILPI